LAPRVSVIIPCYNHARYLPDAIGSVQAQSITDWEIIVVDDGSTDNTRDTVARFADGNRVRYLYQANAGLAGARNTGTREALGAYLVYLDADDELEPRFLEVCLRAVENNQALAGVYTLNSFIDDKGAVLPQRGGEVVAPSKFRARNLEGGFFAVHAALVHAAIVREVGLFDTRLTSEEDWDLWLRLADRYEMEGIAQPLARYRVYPGSMSTNALRMHTNRIVVLSKYFGSPEGDPATWSKDKRSAFGFAYRATAFGMVQQAQAEEGWKWLTQAVLIWPSLLQRVDTFYELIVGNRPSGYRGQVRYPTIEQNGAEVLNWLSDVCTHHLVIRSFQRDAYANIQIALGLLCEQAGEWAPARHHFYRAIGTQPKRVVSYPLLRRLLKLHIGPQITGTLRKARTALRERQ